ncbi:vacuolar protein sorting-associated protein 9 [Phytophthora pseudosyringae]|uniref:Vacuolar protein sorting-associated protein 9 n=1 Tax=Phytophthora pseudosyringae TaxID=221518 RepID=A0A8T1VHI9_9STRA|nr:vacuolar protein sorting-associated protein 9 [Phytophthora pseudosyringae]
MQPSMPRHALEVVVRFGRSKRRAKRVVSQTSSEDLPEPTLSPAPCEIRVLDDNFAEQFHEEAREYGPSKKRVMLRNGGGGRVFSHRRHQFMLWKGQAASNAVKTLRGCYALARRELATWRTRSKTPAAAAAAEEQSSETETSPRDRVSNARRSHSLKRPRSNSCLSAASSASIVSSLSSAAELEEERHKELCRSEFALRVFRSSSLESKPSLCGFAETTSGSHERLLLVHALSLNDDDEETADGASTSRHLPFRSTVIDGRVCVLHNEWV